jgi:SAM-dependent methyltransferase
MKPSLAWRCPRCRVPMPRSNNRVRCDCCHLTWTLDRRLWLTRDATSPDRFDAAAVARLNAMEDRGHFWLEGRRRLVEHVLHRAAPTADGALELGCGTGSMLPLLENRFATVVGIDGHAGLLRRAGQRSSTAALIQADVCSTPVDDAQFDIIAAFDVIEHVDPDVFLAEARRLARPGGRLVLSAPAFPMLWSAMDRRAGHRCRYRIAQLVPELTRSGWQYVGHTHFQCLLFPLIYLCRRLPMGMADGMERRPPAWLARALDVINRLEVRALYRCALPIGSSLFAWARTA